MRRHYDWLFGKISVGLARAVYRQKRAFDAARDSVRQIVFGSSHAHYGYLPGEKGSFSLASGSQDLYTSYELYRRVSDLAELKRIVLFVSVFSPGFQTEKSVYREVCLYYRHYWDIPYRFHREDYFQNRLRQLEERESSFQPVEVTGHRGECDYSFFMGDGTNVPLRVQGHLKNNRRLNGEIDYLDKFLSLAARRGHEAVVVIPPARSDYVACCPPNGEMFETVYALVKRYPDARLLDLFRSPAFVDADFGDSDHLAPRGAAKLTEIIERPWPSALSAGR